MEVKQEIVEIINRQRLKNTLLLMIMVSKLVY